MNKNRRILKKPKPEPRVKPIVTQALAEAQLRFDKVFKRLRRNIAKREALADGTYMAKYWRPHKPRIVVFVLAILASLIVPWFLFAKLEAIGVVALCFMSTCLLTYLTRDRTWDRA